MCWHALTDFDRDECGEPDWLEYLVWLALEYYKKILSHYMCALELFSLEEIYYGIDQEIAEGEAGETRVSKGSLAVI